MVAFLLSVIQILSHILKPHPMKTEPKAYFIWMGVAAVISLIIYAMLIMMPRKARKPLIIGCTFLAGLYFFLEFAIPGGKNGDNFLSGSLPTVGDAVSVIFAFTWGLGLINLSRVHGKTLLRMREGWYNSLAFFFGLIGMGLFGFWTFYDGTKPNPIADTGFKIFFNGFWINLSASVFSLLAFYIVSAAYRAFRIRSKEAAVMMIAAFVVMMGQIPVGQWITHGLPPSLSWLQFQNISEWLMSGISSAAQRGIGFGMSVGALAMSLRIWLSLERGSFFDVEV
jgi:hypothetical protein